MTTICSGCGNNLTKYESLHKDKQFIPCNICQRFTPIEANSYNKGGHKKMTEKQSKKVSKGFEQKVIDEVLNMAQSGKSSKEISEHFSGHPGPAAIKRWCRKNNIEIKK